MACARERSRCRVVGRGARAADRGYVGLGGLRARVDPARIDGALLCRRASRTDARRQVRARRRRRGGARSAYAARRVGAGRHRRRRRHRYRLAGVFGHRHGASCRNRVAIGLFRLSFCLLGRRGDRRSVLVARHRCAAAGDELMARGRRCDAPSGRAPRLLSIRRILLAGGSACRCAPAARRSRPARLDRGSLCARGDDDPADRADGCLSAHHPVRRIDTLRTVRAGTCTSVRRRRQQVPEGRRRSARHSTAPRCRRVCRCGHRGTLLRTRGFARSRLPDGCPCAVGLGDVLRRHAEAYSDAPLCRCGTGRRGPRARRLGPRHHGSRRRQLADPELAPRRLWGARRRLRSFSPAATDAGRGLRSAHCGYPVCHFPGTARLLRDPPPDARRQPSRVRFELDSSRVC